MDLLQHITIETAGIGGNLTHDYLSGKENVKRLYQFSPDMQGLENAIKERSKYPVNRELLYKVLHKQHGKSFLSDSLKSNLELLLQENTFTVTTGHQLNLFTGPLYFIYKIVSVISMARKLNEDKPGNHFVPVYWMNSEDHDFAEINHFFLKGEKIEWKVELSKYGPVGHMSLTGIEPLMNEIGQKFGDQLNGDPIFTFMLRAYQESNNLAEAHREIVNKIFGEYGLVILDQDAGELKSEFVGHIHDEIFNQSSFNQVESTNAYLIENQFKPQVFAREINFFYTGSGYRERIVEKGSEFGLADGSLSWTREALEMELKTNPQHFSPNVVTRPMFQEFTLPNIAYIGGPAEIAYWLQYKSNFDAHHLFYPALLLRDCFLVLPEKKVRKVVELGFSIADFFLPLEGLLNTYIQANFKEEMEIGPMIGSLSAQYDELLAKVVKIDSSMDGMVKAAHQKALNDLDKIVQKMNKALKLKNEVQLNAIRNLHSVMFPNGVLQERLNNVFDHTSNVSAFVAELLTYSNVFDARLKILKD